MNFVVFEQLFRFGGIFGLRDLSWRILRKISVPNAPFSWRLVHPHSATVVRQMEKLKTNKICTLDFAKR